MNDTMQQDTFRAFFAIDFPEDVKAVINSTTTKLIYKNLQYRQIKWIKPENLHITICFLGDISNEQYLAIDKEIQKISKTLEPFAGELTDLQPFPSARKFHSLVLKPEPLIHLKEIALIIEREVRASGIALERQRFRPHVTLGRINSPHKINHKMLAELSIPPITFRVNAIKLFKSEPRPGGSCYTQVACYNFG